MDGIETVKYFVNPMCELSFFNFDVIGFQVIRSHYFPAHMSESKENMNEVLFKTSLRGKRRIISLITNIVLQLSQVFVWEQIRT